MFRKRSVGHFFTKDCSSSVRTEENISKKALATANDTELEQLVEEGKDSKGKVYCGL